MLTRLSTFASKTPAVAGVLLLGLHDTAFRDAIREDSRQTTPSRGVTPRKKVAVEANVESRVRPENGAISQEEVAEYFDSLKQPLNRFFYWFFWFCPSGTRELMKR